jgi:hypothetical protein
LLQPFFLTVACQPEELRESIPLVDLSVAEGKLTLHVPGADKLWTFKSTLEIPIVHVAGVRADPEAAPGWYRGIRMPRTNVPGVITAGTFYQYGKPEKTIIELHDERYSELFVELDDPEEAVKLIRVVSCGTKHSCGCAPP